MVDQNDYLVVEFLGKYNPKLLDLVPDTWVRTIRGKLLCKYPDASEYKTIEQLVRKKNPANEKWRHYSVKVLQSANDYSQGIRRMKRLQDNAAIVSSCAENEENESPNRQNLVPVTLETEADLFNIAGYDNVRYSSSSESESADTCIYRVSLFKGLKWVGLLAANTRLFSQSDASFDSPSPPRKKRIVQGAVHNKRAARASEVAEVRSKTDDEPPASAPLTIQTTRSNISAPSTSACSCSEAQIEKAISQIETNLVAKMDSIRRSLAYDIKKYTKDVTTAIMEQLSGAGVTPVINSERELNITFPIKTLAGFEEFDEKLKEESKETALVHLMSTWCSSVDINHGVSSILSRILDKEVQLQYSGVGKRFNHGGKKNFSATRCFKCLNFTVIKKFQNASIIDVTKAITTWLARAEDRNGGRRTRKSAKTLTQTSAINSESSTAAENTPPTSSQQSADE